jgi:penicillin-binding protein 1C
LLLGWRARSAEHLGRDLVVEESMAVRAYLARSTSTMPSAGHVDMISALRSPGSTLKPFLYGMALDDGLIHSESLLQDVPGVMAITGRATFSMGFSGGVGQLGVVQFAQPAGGAVAGSLRAQTLCRADAHRRHAVGLPALAEPNLSLILGGAGSRLEDLVSGYAPSPGAQATSRLQPDDGC